MAGPLSWDHIWSPYYVQGLAQIRGHDYVRGHDNGKNLDHAWVHDQRSSLLCHGHYYVDVISSWPC